MAPALRTPAGPVRYAVPGPSGSGRADLVLIHGWCCERSAMVSLSEEFGQQHRILEIDLRGHGLSLDTDNDGSMGVGYPRSDADTNSVPAALSTVRIEDYADDIRAICSQAQLHRPILIGHSMGALAVLATLAARPLGGHAPTSGVLLDPAPVVNPNAKQFWAEAVTSLRRDGSGAWRRAFAEGLFLPTDRVSRITLIEAMARTHPQVAAGAASAMATFDGVAALSAVDRPLLVIHGASAERAITSVAQQAGVDLTSGQTVGAGHFGHLEVPEQVMPMIRRWMQVSLPAADSGADSTG